MNNKQDTFSKEVDYFVLQSKGGIVKTQGTSMLPLIPKKGEVELQPIKTLDIKIGDILAFRQQSELFKNRPDLILHRVIAICSFFRKRLFFLKGDNSSFVDVIEKNQIIGRVTRIANSSLSAADESKQATLKKYNTIFCIVYYFTLGIKRKILGDRRYKITSQLARWYWKSVKKLT